MLAHFRLPGARVSQWLGTTGFDIIGSINCENLKDKRDVAFLSFFLFRIKKHLNFIIQQKMHRMYWISYSWMQSYSKTVRTS